MSALDFVQEIAVELHLRRGQVEATVKLLDDGNTIPFIARYRKEATGELNEEQLRSIEERLAYLRNLESRKDEVVRLIEEQGKLTPELEQAIWGAAKLQAVEDLYRPYRQKRRTRATIAKEKGLEPLAVIIMAQQLERGTPEAMALPFIDEAKGVNSASEALSGAADILAEDISDDPALRQAIRQLSYREGKLVSKVPDPSQVSVYQMYYDYQEPVNKIPPHRILAINRGEKEEVLKVSLDVAEGLPERILVERIIRNPRSIFVSLLTATCEDAYKRLLAPSIEREIRAELTERAENQAISIFGKNLRPLLLQPPVRERVVLGIDPGFRTGSKLAIVNPQGDLLETATIYPHPPINHRSQALDALRKLIAMYQVSLIAIGNGTASRETEQLVSELIAALGDQQLYYVIVSEAGASVYSASKLAKEEFPDLDVTIRGAVSIARRLQDPLAELVKIEPKAIGVGQYQHDVNQNRLGQSLTGVVESCVNYVGVDLNTASSSLLQYVSGISSTVSKNIIKYRQEKGKFRSRKDLSKVARLGDATFLQCAGFLRIQDGEDPLDNTPVHPESYIIAKQILAELGFQPADLRDKDRLQTIRQDLAKTSADHIAKRLDAGLPTVRDIIEALQKPGRDPREELPKPILRTDVLSMEDLQAGMELLGTVRNVVDFGAFIDIGVKEDGLVHVSQLADRFIRHPTEAVTVGEVVNVRVLEIDRVRKRIALTMRL